MGSSTQVLKLGRVAAVPRGVMRWSAWAMQVGMVGLMGCGGSAGAAPTRHAGDVQAAPGISVLPSYENARPLSRRMQFAWTLAEESLGLKAPDVPARGDIESMRAWSEHTLTPWLRRKTHTVQAARHELDLAAEESHEQRILAGALVGLIYEDVARYLAELPVPAELLREPEIAAVYRDILDFQASPYREHARRAYLACAQNAVRPRSMADWSSFCAARADRLPPSRYARLSQGGTEVTVTLEP